jgi:hypothetical protein
MTRLIVTMMALAGTVSMTQAQDASTGRDSAGVFIKSGDTKLSIGGFAQFRYYANFRDGAGDNEDFTSGFTTRRTRLSFQGNLTKELSFRIDGDVTASTGVFGSTADTYMDYKFDDNWSARLGQFKAPILKEELIGDTNQQFVERSLMNATFTGARTQGLQLGYKGDAVRGWAMVSDGLRASNTDFISDRESDFALTGRVEFKWAGDDWKQFDRFTSWRGSEYAGMLGGAVHYQDGGETGGTTDQSTLLYTIDALSQGDGWNIYVAGVGRNTEPATGDSFDDFGALVQGGVFVSEQTEVFARYTFVSPDDNRVNGNDFNEIGAGVGYYLFPKSASAKFTADANWTLDDQAGSSSIVRPSANDGFLASSEDNQFYIRLQMQIQF